MSDVFKVRCPCNAIFSPTVRTQRVCSACEGQRVERERAVAMARFAAQKPPADGPVSADGIRCPQCKTLNRWSMSHWKCLEPWHTEVVCCGQAILITDEMRGYVDAHHPATSERP